MKEITCIPELKTRYYIDEIGRVYSDYKKDYLILQENHKGYLRAYLSINNHVRGFFVHRLIMITYKPCDNMEKLEVNHINGDKKDNRIENLEWVTSKENIAHAIENNLRADCKGEKNGFSILTENDVKWIINELLLKRMSQTEMANRIGCSKATISAIKHHRNWNHLTKDIKFD